MSHKQLCVRLAVAVLGFGAVAATAGPIPTLTPQGIALGFNLSVVVSNLPTNNGSSFDVLGSAVNSDGNIILNASRDSNGPRNYVFHDTDNQTVGDAITSSPFSGFASALAFSNGSVWASALGGRLVRLNNDGSVNTVYDGSNGNPSIIASQGLWTNPVTGHLLAGNPLFDIDVSGATPSETTVNSSFFADGLTVSPDGHFVYGSSGQIVDLTTGQLVPGGFGSVSGADGMGVIASSDQSLNGDIIVNTTTGNIVLVDHVTFAQTILASGGGYGDYTSPDRNNGSLLLSSSNNLLRLTCGQDCSIGGPPPPPPGVPEPGTLALLMLALGVLGRALVRTR